MLTLALPQGAAARSGRMLVLAIQGPHLSEIEERILREELLRFLADAGEDIVPVMETERYVESGNRLRAVDDAAARLIASELDAGRVYFFNHRRVGGREEFTVRNGQGDVRVIVIDSPRDFHSFVGVASRKLAETIRSMDGEGRNGDAAVH
jgi:hypothetical protein